MLNRVEMNQEFGPKLDLLHVGAEIDAPGGEGLRKAAAPRPSWGRGARDGG